MGNIYKWDGNSLDVISPTSVFVWTNIVIISDGANVKVYENNYKKLDFSGTTNHSNFLVIGDSRYTGIMEDTFLGRLMIFVYTIVFFLKQKLMHFITKVVGEISIIIP